MLPTSPQRFSCQDCEASRTEGGQVALYRRRLKASGFKRGRPVTPPPPGFVTAAEVAKAVGVSLHTVYTWTKEGRLPCNRDTPRRTFYRMEDVMAATVEFRRKKEAHVEEVEKTEEVAKDEISSGHQNAGVAQLLLARAKEYRKQGRPEAEAALLWSVLEILDVVEPG